MKTNRRLIFLLLTLVMLCSVLPFSAFAEEDYGFYISDKLITSANYADPTIMYGGALAYDPLTNTLTFSGCNISHSDDPFVKYPKSDTLNVVVHGSNVVSGYFFEAENGGSIDFSAESTGTLVIGKYNMNHNGINASRVTVNGGELRINSTRYGIEAGAVEVKGGSVYIYTSPAEYENREVGISAMDMSVSGGKVGILGYKQGINVKRVLDINGGSVEVSGAPDIGVKGNQVTLTGGSLSAEGGNYGVFASNLSVSGGAKLCADMTDPDSDGYAVHAQGDFDVDTNVHFVSDPADGFVGNLPYGGKTVFRSENQPASKAVILPVISCFVSKNGGEEEEVSWQYGGENSTVVNAYHVPVDEEWTVRLLLNEPNRQINIIPQQGPRPEASQFLSYTKEGSREIEFTFKPTYLPKGTVSEDSLGSESSNNRFGATVYVAPSEQTSLLYRKGYIRFVAVPGTIKIEIPDIVVPKGTRTTIPISIKNAAGEELSDPNFGISILSDNPFNDEYFNAAYFVKRASGYELYFDAKSGCPDKVWDAVATEWKDRNGNYNTQTVAFSLSVVCPCEIGILDHHEAKDAVCAASGNSEYWQCAECGKLFADKDGKNEITDPKTVFIPALGHEWDKAAKAEYLKSAADCENPAVYYESCKHCGISAKELYDLRAAAARFTPGSNETVNIDGVEFYILAVDDGKALLLTKDVVAAGKAFDADSPKWPESDIRAWINGEWLEGMPVLKNIVQTSEIKTRVSHDDTAGNFDTTYDKVFLLSKPDIDGIHNTNSPTVADDYTYNGKMLTPPSDMLWKASDNAGNKMFWWLRSPYYNGSRVAYVSDYGFVVSRDYYRTTELDAVRPAVWVRLADPAPEWQKTIAGINPGSADTVTIDGVEFHVLAKDAAKGTALLLTKHVLFNDAALMFGATPSWADSKLRKFMNGIMPETNDGYRFFYPTKAPTLQQYAQETEIYTPAGYDSTELVMTRDTVFLLSEADLFGTQNDHPEAGTKVFTYNGSPLLPPGGSWIATDVNGTPRYWWLRSPRNNPYSVAQILDSGNLNSIDSDAYDYYGIRGVRPALWIQYKEPIPEPETFTYREPLGHDWGTASYNWLAMNGVIKGCYAQHTCTREGCKKGEYESISATRVMTTAPTCTEKGQYTYTAIFTKAGFETQHEYRDITPLGHDLIHHDAKSATCTEHGWNEYDTCSRCDHTTYVESPALGHDLIHHDAKSATCTEHGWNEYDTCSRCDHTTYVESPALGHDLIHHDAKSATCTEHGWNEYDTCSRCDHTTYVESPALGHDFGEWYVAQKPTDREKGLEKRICKNCDHFETRELDMIEYKVDPVDTEHGDAEINPENPKSGDDVKITPKPDEGFEVDEIKVTDKNGNEIDISPNRDGTYTFVMPPDDVKIEITYKEAKNDFPVAPQTGDNFSIVFWMTLMCLSAAWIYILIVKRNFKKHKNS